MAPIAQLLSRIAVLLPGSTANKALPKADQPANFSNSTLGTIRSLLADSANKSWELGTRAQALLEFESPSFSVFSKDAFPPSAKSSEESDLESLLDIASDAVSSATERKSKTLWEDSAVGDPASLGVAVVIANWTRTDLDDDTYSTAASKQIDYLLNDAPRTNAGAISHRSDDVQLWSDFIYMVPPYLAYFGALKGDEVILEEAYRQISLYRDVMVTDEEKGLWKHIMLGKYSDDTHWATGNAWAAGGMLRVLKTLNNTEPIKDYDSTKQQEDLVQWIDDILDSSWSRQTNSGAVHNVIDDADTFEDSASTALLAAVTYRMAVHTGNTDHVQKANKATEYIRDSIDEEGKLRNTVDPLDFHVQLADGAVSAEAQAFVLLLEAAIREFNEHFFTL